MALLVASGIDGWISNDDLASEIRASAPGLDIRTPETIGDPAEVRMLVLSSLRDDLVARLPNLDLVQKLGAGVETIVAHPALAPHVRVTRLKPEAPAREIAEWALAYVLRRQRNMDFHDAAQARADWAPKAPREAPETVVGVLGLGHIGGYAARVFRDLGFRVLGWRRSPKALEGVTCLHGASGLSDLLAQADHVVAILPSTGETRGMFDAAMFARMKPGAGFLNAGRGDLVVEPDLMAALDAGRPDYAVLDVVHTEPLPPEDPLWRHPRVTITPHVSGWHLGDAMKDVAENYKRLIAGDALLHEVDRARGY